MSLMERIKESTILSQQERLTMVILSRETMTANELTATLMSDPYNLTFKEVASALDGLKQKGLIVLNEFRPDARTFTIDAYLTFAHNWVFKL